MLTSKQITIAAKMFELRDTMKRLLSLVMQATGNTNPLSAVIPMAKYLSANGRNPTLLMAVAVDMSDS